MKTNQYTIKFGDKQLKIIYVLIGLVVLLMLFSDFKAQTLLHKMKKMTIMENVTTTQVVEHAKNGGVLEKFFSMFHKHSGAVVTSTPTSSTQSSDGITTGETTTSTSSSGNIIANTKQITPTVPAQTVTGHTTTTHIEAIKKSATINSTHLTPNSQSTNNNVNTTSVSQKMTQIQLANDDKASAAPAKQYKVEKIYGIDVKVPVN